MLPVKFLGICSSDVLWLPLTCCALLSTRLKINFLLPSVILLHCAPFAVMGLSAACYLAVKRLWSVCGSVSRGDKVGAQVWKCSF